MSKISYVIENIMHDMCNVSKLSQILNINIKSYRIQINYHEFYTTFCTNLESILRI